ncbi:MAG: hypothetical protein QM817_01625 [Archangium sp.]
MRTRHALTLVAALSFPALAVDPRPVAPVLRENQPPPLATPKQPKKNGAKKFVQRRLARPFAGEGTPLIVSTTERVKLRPMSDATFEFEPGVPMKSAWPDASTAWLVRGDQVASGRALFGSFTVLSDGSRAKNGFQALAELDADGDGFVSASDAQFTSLRLWFDRDGDRRVSEGELEPLAPQMRLPLQFEANRRCDAAGNCIVERARLDDGRWLFDLHLAMRSLEPLALR